MWSGGGGRGGQITEGGCVRGCGWSWGGGGGAEEGGRD